jgi:hypothetical protein
MAVDLYDESTRIYCKYNSAGAVISFRTSDGRLEINLRFYAEQGAVFSVISFAKRPILSVDTPGAEFITRPTPLEESAATARRLALPKDWIKHCLENHGSDCQHTRPNGMSMPTRLVDVGNLGSAEPPCLVVEPYESGD